MKFPAGSLLLLLHPNTLGTRRLGLTVSGKVGNSVTRSRVKRLLREVFRKLRAALPPSLDVVVVARPSAAKTSLEGLTADFLKAAEQARRRMASPQRDLPRSPEGEAP
jgi:ribonuclease P protein component